MKAVQEGQDLPSTMAVLAVQKAAAVQEGQEERCLLPEEPMTAQQEQQVRHTAAGVAVEEQPGYPAPMHSLQDSDDGRSDAANRQ